MIRYTEETVLPRLDRTLLEVEEQRRRAGRVAVGSRAQRRDESRVAHASA